MLNKLKPYLFLTILTSALFLPGIRVIPMLDRDSAHFAQATKQMLQTGHYFQIRFQEKTRFQKPPGINWLQALSVKAFGDGYHPVWPYRLPSFLGGLLSVLLTFSFAKRFICEKTALLAGSLLAISLLLVLESHIAVIDASLLSAVVLMQGALWVIYDDYQKGFDTHWGYSLLFWLAMSYGFLLKGVTPLVGFLTIIALSLVEGRLNWLKKLRFSQGIIILALNLLWLLQLNHQEGSNYLLKMIQKDLLPKLKGGHESHGQPPFFHLAILPFTFWPASLFLWPMIIRAIQFRKQTVETFLLAWIMPTWLFFDLMPTKLPQYVLPTFPALAILMALAIIHMDKLKMGAQQQRLMNIAAFIWLGLSIALSAFLAYIPYYLKIPLPFISLSLVLSISLLSGISVFLFIKRNYLNSVKPLLLAAVIAFFIVFQWMMPQLKPLWLTDRIAQTIDHKSLAINKHNPLLVIGFNEPSLVFNLNTDSVLFTNLKTLRQLVKDKPSVFLLIDSDEKINFLKHAKNHIRLIKQFNGFNYSKGHWVNLSLLEVSKHADR